MAGTEIGGPLAIGGKGYPAGTAKVTIYFLNCEYIGMELIERCGQEIIESILNNWWGQIESNLEFGQVRPISEDVVSEKVKELTSNPPTIMLRLTVHFDSGMYLLCPFNFVLEKVRRNCE